MNTINVLILAGGDGSEHDVSIVSSQYLEKVLNSNKKFNIKKVIIINKSYTSFHVSSRENPCLHSMISVFLLHPRCLRMTHRTI